jgi:hypothetical protein
MTGSGISSQEVDETEKGGPVRDISQGLAASTEEGWKSYLTDCVCTTVTDDRTVIWKKAVAVRKW